MNRRNFLSLPLIAAPDHAARPNIVMGPEGAPAGDPGWADIGCQGAQSDRFHAYPVWPPTRSGLMTGRSPVRLGVMYSVIRPWSGHGVPATEHFPPQSFKAAGYQTAAIGKWHLGHSHVKCLPDSRGFDHLSAAKTGSAARRNVS